jgi:CubicO group peptidase (beta-lactamase class C family)
MTTTIEPLLKTQFFAATAAEEAKQEQMLGGVALPLYGTVKPGFEPVRDAFAANLLTGCDVGAAAAVFIDGEPVVDLWGGYFDHTYTREWQRDTIVQLFSSTKTMSALCALLLADRGEIDVNAPVTKYWPEFGAAGKSNVLVRHILGHASGVAGWTEAMTLDDIYDIEKSCALLARQEPWWEPGRASGYHGFNFGHLVGEIIRRVTGQTLGKFFRKEIAEPLGVEYYIGTPAEKDSQVSLIMQGYPIQPGGNALFKRALLNPPARPFDTWSLGWRRSEMGGLNGHGNAYAIAALQSLVANGGTKGKTVLSDKGRLRVLEPQTTGVDLVLGIPMVWGMGYCLIPWITPADVAAAPPKVAERLGKRVGHWGGGGGSMSYVDLDARLSFGYTPNRWITGPHEHDRSMNVLRAVYGCLARQAR